jgi:hypothetical protein
MKHDITTKQGLEHFVNGGVEIDYNDYNRTTIFELELKDFTPFHISNADPLGSAYLM